MGLVVGWVGDWWWCGGDGGLGVVGWVVMGWGWLGGWWG